MIVVGISPLMVINAYFFIILSLAGMVVKCLRFMSMFLSKSRV